MAFLSVAGLAWPDSPLISFDCDLEYGELVTYTYSQRIEAGTSGVRSRECLDRGGLQSSTRTCSDLRA